MMRVGGIASGMDVEAMVNKLMEAERIPLQKLQQQQTTLEWKRDAFRDVNSSLLELDNIVRDMKYTKFYNSKSTTSSNSSVATATAGSGASNGSYDINV
ncbi:MAG TPA: flagellar cap protein FliD N-terminal domain-containing protein, partial [Pseudogracilibacillus sp.]|nr:flagellar cap protein FliD N-terminal domain-containing protein [Pseudogracilibacillus sp.]